MHHDGLDPVFTWDELEPFLKKVKAPMKFLADRVPMAAMVGYARV